MAIPILNIVLIERHLVTTCMSEHSRIRVEFDVCVVLFPYKRISYYPHRLQRRKATTRPLVRDAFSESGSEWPHHLRDDVLIPEARTLAAFASMAYAHRPPSRRM